MNLEDYTKYYIQGSDHYLIPKDVFKELFNEMINWKEETTELKKQLENKYKKVGTLTSELLYEENTKLINQQKEFVNYLEDEIQKKRGKATTLTSFTRNVVPLKHCLQKYKSIIGDDK